MTAKRASLRKFSIPRPVNGEIFRPTNRKDQHRDGGDIGKIDMRNAMTAVMLVVAINVCNCWRGHCHHNMRTDDKYGNSGQIQQPLAISSPGKQPT